MRRVRFPMLRRAASERGAAAVEIAATLPILVLLLMGIAELGRYYFVLHSLQFGAREGTRLATVGRTLADGEGNPMTREDSIKQKIRQNVSVAVNPDDVSISIYPVGSDYGDPQNWEGQANPGEGGQYMRVRVRYIHHFIVPLSGLFFPAGGSVIEAQCTYRNELFS